MLSRCARSLRSSLSTQCMLQLGGNEGLQQASCSAFLNSCLNRGRTASTSHNQHSNLGLHSACSTSTPLGQSMAATLQGSQIHQSVRNYAAPAATPQLKIKRRRSSTKLYSVLNNKLRSNFEQVRQSKDIHAHGRKILDTHAHTHAHVRVHTQTHTHTNTHTHTHTHTTHTHTNTRRIHTYPIAGVADSEAHRGGSVAL